MENDAEIIRSLGRLEGKCDNILTRLDNHMDRMNRIDEDIEDVRDKIEKVKEKVASVEKKQYAVTVLATFVWGVIVILIKKFL